MAVRTPLCGSVMSAVSAASVSSAMVSVVRPAGRRGGGVGGDERLGGGVVCGLAGAGWKLRAAFHRYSRTCTKSMMMLTWMFRALAWAANRSSWAGAPVTALGAGVHHTCGAHRRRTSAAGIGGVLLLLRTHVQVGLRQQPQQFPTGAGQLALDLLQSPAQRLRAGHPHRQRRELRRSPVVGQRLLDLLLQPGRNPATVPVAEFVVVVVVVDCHRRVPLASPSVLAPSLPTVAAHRVIRTRIPRSATQLHRPGRTVPRRRDQPAALYQPPALERIPSRAEGPAPARR
ncbi:hypothetical protein [Catenulispora yoronensis]|uniref:hypothetical protein n=1 Tax=Catenulispora yoronensis TaxID=450799 RepID=UPI0031DDFC1C